MAYFSNGTEFMMWQESNCEVCLHDMETCPILAVHEHYNPSQFRREIERCILERLIPTENGFAGTCKMLIRKLTDKELSELSLNVARIMQSDISQKEKDDQIHCLKLIKQVEDENRKESQ